MPESHVNTPSNVPLFLQQIIIFFCQCNYKFSESCIPSLAIRKKKNDMFCEKRQTNGLPVENLLRAKRGIKMWPFLPHPFWPFFFIDIEDLPDYINWYIFWNQKQSVALKLSFVSCLWVATNSGEVEKTCPQNCQVIDLSSNIIACPSSLVTIFADGLTLKQQHSAITW